MYLNNDYSSLQLSVVLTLKLHHSVCATLTVYEALWLDRPSLHPGPAHRLLLDPEWVILSLHILVCSLAIVILIL